MSAEAFEQQKHKLKTLSVKTNDLARLVLVEGLTAAEAAKRVGMSRQNVSKTMQRVNFFLADIPSDWEYFEACWMPKNMAAEVRERLRLVKKE